MRILDLPRRPRRNRKTAAIRELVAETALLPQDFICPFFIKDGNNVQEEVPSLPGVYRWSIDLLLKEIERLCRYGLRAVMLFPVVPSELKDAYGSYSSNPKNILCRGISQVKKRFPDLCVISDIALDPYTTHGHDGILSSEGEILNDESVHILGNIATLHAEMGADIVAPSDMMDGRIAYIRSKLDQVGFVQTLILSYSVKYASSLYHPFRDALSSHAQGDKQSYQMNPKNVLEALLESSLDEKEGADMLMVKPAGLYLDVLFRVRSQSKLPIVAYQVSGEYAMILAASHRGWVQKDAVLMEALVGIKRAGADMIVSYATPKVLKHLYEEREFFREPHVEKRSQIL
ncbi:porphobilinogen synthase [Chlamydia pecorum]|uniref:Delta-aminolevulinic acid dehydratase n=1 Tax=Chlamydia pecorum (strain ATCC VR-628 / DSM 29919 / E58) TaxID=331635 RepID=A0AA34RCP1_CHLPE|nr:porphobilinogen synthase [Chlamydia pecorum]AEB41306.1 delta-aminolevulinic acid dehydratase [Chlamydia pecorum E58]ETF38660.1 delta-aminolevulinic acid dehydratase [Chlamydia pecorum VR629]UFP06874.1 porphobilinogen synthase [Chlamydia pecorum]UJT76683.1 delta-aminolevulinic acid dehydratase [Chlamydia pecorum]